MKMKKANNAMRRCVTMMTMAMGLAVNAADVAYSRQQLFPGFDGKLCKIQPSFSTDGKGLVLLGYQKLLLSGSDVFYGQYLARSTDGGATWSEPRLAEALADTRENGFRVAHYATVHYNRAKNIWYGMGQACRYENDEHPLQRVVDGQPYSRPIYVKLDPTTASYTEIKPMAFPLPFAGCLPFGQQVELPDGDMLVPFYYEPFGVKRNATDAFAVLSRIVVARCRLDGEGARILAVGNPIACDGLRRGVGEPSLAQIGGKFYMTLRSDEAGMWCVSDDGLNFSAPKRWTWTDGKEIGNRNTQQHWLKVGEKLYLAYTRETPTNGHVFRNRAPIFLAEFDPTRGGLVRETEMPIVPERGARLGNFCCAQDGCGGAWLLTAEWMQPLGCEKYGSDNSLWLVKVAEKPKRKRGALVLTFDDGHFANWDKALPIFDRYGAHATFFVNGKLDAAKLDKMRTYQSYGHSVGLHGFRHIRATPLVAEKGVDAWFKAEIEPQLAALRQTKLAIKNFAYPMSDRNATTDAALAPHFRRMRTGHVFGRDPKKVPLATCDEAFVSRAQLASSPVVRGMGFGSQFPDIAADLEQGLARLAERDEVLVLYTHDIKAQSDGDAHNTSLDVLERILKRAHELGVDVVGFDELCAAPDAPLPPSAATDVKPNVVKVSITTSLGDMALELDAAKAPITVSNFVAYAKAGYYNGTVFHRVINGFMIQGGGFTPDMAQKETRPPIKNEAANGLKNDRGTIAMARTMVVDSATSQFFINLKDNGFLDHVAPNPRQFGYAVFGRVTKGMDVVDKIAQVKTGSVGYFQDVPVEPVIIKRVAIEE